ncbi:MAG: hypothetical protein IPL32_00845 [Chloracidobacterium sp.]|nr:hypothetical protein [Chloracidobacterium sp.]
MNTLKKTGGVIFGALFTGCALATLLYFPGKNDHSSTGLGPASDWAWLGLIVGGVLGIVIGGISGAVVVGFQLGILKATLFGLILNLILAVIAFSILENNFLVLVLIIVGAVNGAVVSFIGVERTRGDAFLK